MNKFTRNMNNSLKNYLKKLRKGIIIFNLKIG